MIERRRGRLGGREKEGEKGREREREKREEEERSRSRERDRERTKKNKSLFSFFRPCFFIELSNRESDYFTIKNGKNRVCARGDCVFEFEREREMMFCFVFCFRPPVLKKKMFSFFFFFLNPEPCERKMGNYTLLGILLCLARCRERGAKLFYGWGGGRKKGEQKEKTSSKENKAPLKNEKNTKILTSFLPSA